MDVRRLINDNDDDDNDDDNIKVDYLLCVNYCILYILFNNFCYNFMKYY